MYVLSNLPEKINFKLSSLLDIEIKTEKTTENPKAVLLMDKPGGTGNFILPDKTLVIMQGREEDINRAEKYLQQGVPEKNIYYIMPGQKILLSKLVEKLQEMLVDQAGEENEDILDVFDESFFTNQPSEKKEAKRDKIVAVMGYRGGTGRTTIAAAMAAHCTESGERVAIIDLGLPQAIYRHLGSPKEPGEEKHNFKYSKTPYGDIYTPAVQVWEVTPELLSELIQVLIFQYRRIIIDCAAAMPESLSTIINQHADVTIVVTDADTIQTVEPALNLDVQGIFIYNKEDQSTSKELIEELISPQSMLVIGTDSYGCQSALAAEMPANLKSLELAKKIGQLMSMIGKEK
ncbi:hypothetical protein JCM39194_25380 [Desulfotomaculum varum]